MDEEDLKNFLEEHKNDVGWVRPENDLDGIVLHSRVWDESIRVDLRKLSEITGEQILLMIQGGKNVEQMTRVTGYFSKVAGWNAGKRGELKERHRIGNDLLGGG